MKFSRFMVLLVMLSILGVVFAEIIPEWSIKFGENVFDYHISTTSNGSYIVVGGNSYLDNNQEKLNILVYLIDNKGKILWNKTIATSATDGFGMEDVKISKNGNYIVAVVDCSNGRGIYKQYVFILDKNGTILKKYNIKNEMPYLFISEDGKYVFVGVKDKVYLIDRDNEISWIYETSGDITSMDMAKNNICVVGDEDGYVYLYNTSGLIWSYQTNESIEHVSIHPNGEVIGVCGYNNTIYLLNPNGRLIKQSHIHTGDDWIVFFKITNKSNILIGCSIGCLYCLDKNLQPLWKIKISELYDKICITPDGKYTALVNNFGDFPFEFRNEGLYVLNEHGNILWRYSKGYVYDIEIADDGKYVVAVINDDLYLFNNQKCIKNYTPETLDYSEDIKFIIHITAIILAVLILSLILVLYLIKLENKKKQQI